MTSFEAYLRLGYQHITDFNGYDHILFIVALCAVYQLRDWKRVLLLVTAFTLGHSVTLALATLRLFTYRADVIEFLIPCTILVTAISNFFFRHSENHLSEARPQFLRYLLALCFGLIHGLGFSNFLRSMLGQEASIVQPLLAFNVGLEAGQLIIVLIVLGIAFLFNHLLKVQFRYWNGIVSGVVAIIALNLIYKAWIF
jgi:hypothetical protein